MANPKPRSSRFWNSESSETASEASEVDFETVRHLISEYVEQVKTALPERENLLKMGDDLLKKMESYGARKSASGENSEKNKSNSSLDGLGVDVDAASFSPVRTVSPKSGHVLEEISHKGSPASGTWCHKQFEFLEKVGKGAFGKVFKCEHRSDGKTYALKMIPLEKGHEAAAYREVKIFSSLYHSSVVRYHQAWIESKYPTADYFDDSDSSYSQDSADEMKILCIQMEFCPKTLESEMQRGLSFEKMKKYITQVAEGLAYIHAEGVIHRDVSRKNIFLDPSDNVKIGDFGLAFFKDFPATEEPDVSLGMRHYKAPEVGKGKKAITDKADIYSLGWLMLEMLHPMDTDHERLEVYTTFKNVGILPEIPGVNRSAAEVMGELLGKSPDQRPPASEALVMIRGMDEGF